MSCKLTVSVLSASNLRGSKSDRVSSSVKIGLQPRANNIEYQHMDFLEHKESPVVESVNPVYDFSVCFDLSRQDSHVHHF